MKILGRWQRSVIAVSRRFMADQCLVHASALAYISLLSLVPLLAVMFAVLKGLGIQNRLEPLLLSRLSLNPETSAAIIGYIDRTQLATLGTLGALTLVLSVIGVLGAIEATFNHIWRVTQGRSLWRKLTDFLGVVLLTPFLLLMGVTITSSLQVQAVLDWASTTQGIGTAALQVLGLVPIGINALAIGLLYAVLPNRRPYPRAIVGSALLAGAAWHVVQWLYVSLQIGVAQYNAIYGVMSQLPITLVWLYVSWVIVLAGAELAAFAELGGEPAGRVCPHEGAVALEILVRSARAFRSGEGPLDAVRLARSLRVPLGTVLRICTQLDTWGWVRAVDAVPGRVVLTRDAAQIDLGQLALLPAGRIPRNCSPEVLALLGDLEERTRAGWRSLRLPDTGSGESRTPLDAVKD